MGIKLDGDGSIMLDTVTLGDIDGGKRYQGDGAGDGAS